MTLINLLYYEHRSDKSKNTFTYENITFNFEKGNNNKFPFLDLLINNESDFETFLFHEKTHFGLLLNYFCFVSDTLCLILICFD